MVWLIDLLTSVMTRDAKVGDYEGTGFDRAMTSQTSGLTGARSRKRITVASAVPIICGASLLIG